MLGVCFLSGTIAGGAMLGVGQLARAIPRAHAVSPEMRSVAVLMAAFAEGLGSIAVVVGMLAFLLPDEISVIPAAALVVVPAAVLGVPALRMVSPLTDIASVRSLLVLLGAFMAGLGILVLVVALMGLLVADDGGNGVADMDLLSGAIGIVGAASAIGVGYVGARAIRALGGDSRAGGAAPDPDAIRGRTVTQVAVLEGIGVMCLVIGLLLVVLE